MAYIPPNPNGQATMANSAPVVVASDQSNLPANIKQINGTSISLGNTTMSASLPVTLASNDTNTTPFVTSGGGGYVRQDTTATIAKESGGNLATLAGAVTSSVLQDNIKNVGGSAVATAATGIMKVGVTDGSGNAINSTSNALNVNVSSGGIANTSAFTASTTATWGTGTSVNTTLAQTSTGYGTATLTTIETGTTTTAGVLTFEVYDGTNWWAVQGQQIGSFTIQSTYTLVNNTNVAWQFDIAGFQQFRVRLSTAITGTGTPQVVILLQLSAEPNDITPTIGQSVAANLNATVVPGNATGSAVPASAFYIAGVNGGNLKGLTLDASGELILTGGTISAGDGMAWNNPSEILSLNSVYNGSTWDRTRSSATASGTTGTGLLGTGAMGIYNSSAPSTSAGDYYPMQLDANANLKVNIAKGSPTASSTVTSVAGATSSTQLLASNTARTGAYFFNDSTATLYLAFAGSASTSAYTVQVASDWFYEMPTTPVYTGAIYGIWSAANGNVRITELS